MWSNTSFKIAEGFIYNLYQLQHMKWLFVVFALILVLPTAIADQHTTPASAPVDITQETQSRFLSAEAQRLIKDEMTNVRDELKGYQDENFIALDGEMRSVIGRAQKQLIIGALGAFLLGGGIVAIIMFNVARKYSYERVIEQQEQFRMQQEEMHQDPNVQAMQQEDWGNLQQAVNPTISQEYGQSFASNTSQFSGWQSDAPYKGGWQWNGGNQQ